MYEWFLPPRNCRHSVLPSCWNLRRRNAWSRGLSFIHFWLIIMQYQIFFGNRGIQMIEKIMKIFLKFYNIQIVYLNFDYSWFLELLKSCMKLFAWLGMYYLQFLGNFPIQSSILDCVDCKKCFFLTHMSLFGCKKCLTDWPLFDSELMPALPTDGMFAIDNMLCKTHSSVIDLVSWQWRDDRGVWHPYTSIDGKIIEVRPSHRSVMQYYNIWMIFLVRLELYLML